MKLPHLFHRAPQASSQSNETRRIPHWRRRACVGALTLCVAGIAGFADSSVAQEISIEEPTGTTLGGSVIVWGFVGLPEPLDNVENVNSGDHHGIALKTNGDVFVWGNLGEGEGDIPPGLTGVRSVSGGGYHNVALKYDGTLAAWGYNDYGQATVPPGLTDVKAIDAGVFHSVAVKSDGTVVAWGENGSGQAAVPPGLTGVKAVAAGFFHTLALKTDGTVVAWGDNGSGQTDVPPGLSGVTAIAAGPGGHSVALKSDGTVVAWGSNNSGQCNVPLGLTGVKAIAAGFLHTAALKSDGTVVVWGLNNAGQTIVPDGLSHVQAISAGTYHTLALTSPTVTFADQNLGGSATRTFTIKNKDSVALNVTSVTLAGADASEFTLNASEMLTTVPGPTGSTTFTVTFAPTSEGQKNATITVASNDADEGSFEIVLSGAGVVAPEISIEQPAGTPLANPEVAFADEIVGITSAAKTFAVKNSGNTALHISGVSLSGPDAADFVLDVSDSASTLDPLTGETTFTVAFAPTSGGLKSATLTVASDDTDEGSYEIALSGTGVAIPEISVFDGESTFPLDERADNSGTATFEDTIADGSAISRTFTIKNTGSGVLTGLAVTTTNSDEFGVSELSVTALEPDETATFTVTFMPGSTTARSAVISIESDDADENPFRIAVAGTGVLPPAVPDSAFLSGRRGAVINVLANDPGVNPVNTTITFPTAPLYGTVSVVGGKVRYIPTGVLPLGGDTFTYHFDDGQGGTGTGTVTVANIAAIAGEFDGLINVPLPPITVRAPEIDGAARHRQSGYLRMSLTRTGSYTGVLTFAGTLLNQIGQTNSGTYAFMGVLDTSGKIVRTIQRRGLPPITFALALDAVTGEFTGTATSTDGEVEFTSELTLAKRTAAGGRTGFYTMQLAPDSMPGTPTGTGTVIIRVAAGGNTALVGRLGDGKAFSTAGFFHANGTIPLYAVLYNGAAPSRGSLRGTVEIPNVTLRTPFPRSGLEWFKPARPTDALYPEGFTAYPEMSLVAP